MDDILLIAVWLVSGILGAGWSFAYLQDEFNYYADKNRAGDLGFSLLIFILGPMGASAIFITTNFAKHGWRLWPKKAEDQ